MPAVLMCNHRMNERMRRATAAAVACGLLFIAPTGYSNGMRLVSQDAFAAARGDAFAATANNASAIYYNPAGITQLEATSIRAGLAAIYYNVEFTAPAGAANSGTTHEIEENVAVAPQFFLVHSLTDAPLAFGLGIYAPYGAGIEWPQDTGFRTVGISSEVTYLRVNPVVAVELLPSLSLAGGVMVDYAELNLRQGIRAAASPILRDSLEFEGDGWSAGYNLGVLWEVVPTITLGGTLRSSTSFTLEGQTEVEFQPTAPLEIISAEAPIEFPLTAVAGISWRPTPRWNLEVNVDYTDWSVVDTVTIDQAKTPIAGGPQDYPIELQWQASWNYSAGVTYQFPNGWNVSGGYMFSEGSVPDTYYSPLAADLDRHFVSLGSGYESATLQFHLAYQFGYGPDHTVSGSTGPNHWARVRGQDSDGTYSFVSHTLLASLTFKF
jgi:long-chain fatty acid transport protein